MVKGQISWVEVSAESKQQGKTVSLASQVKERIARYGVGTILDEEILAVLSDVPIEKIKSFIEEYVEIGEICKNIDSLDVTEAQRKKLLMIFEFSKRAKYVGKDKVTLDSSTKAGEFMKDFLSMKQVEEFAMVALSSQNQVIKAMVLSKGTVNESIIYTREIVKAALMYNAVSVIIGHNHPGNSPKPSQADIQVTRIISDSLKILNIKLLDHFIVFDNGLTSFAENGLL